MKLLPPRVVSATAAFVAERARGARRRLGLERRAGAASAEDWLNETRLAVYPKIVLTLYLIVAVIWAFMSKDLVDGAHKPLGYDFICFWSASDLALAGRAADAYDPIKIFAAQQRAVPASGVVFLWPYPPVFFLVVLPLALLPYLWAYGLWVLATLAGYVACLRNVVASRHTVWLLLAFPGAFINAMQGHNGFLSAILVAAACLNLERRPVLAGILIGALCYKPHLGLLFPLVLLAGRHWMAFAAAALTTAALFALSALAFGLETWVAFWNSLATQRHVFEIGSVPWHKMTSLFVSARMLGIGISFAYALHIIAAVAVTGLTVHAWYRGRGTMGLRIALLAVAMLLATPYAFDYDLVILALPIALVAAHGLGHGWRPGTRTVLVATWIAPLVLPAVAEYSSLQLMPLMLAVFFAFIYRQLDATPEHAARPAGSPLAHSA